MENVDQPDRPFDSVQIVRPGEFIVLPPSVLERRRVSELFPGEWTFAQTGTLVIDTFTRSLMIDTAELLPDHVPDSENGLGSLPAIMSVSTAEELTTGVSKAFIADIRHVTKILHLDRNLTQGVGSVEYMAAEQRFGAVALAGVILSDPQAEGDGIMYIGENRFLESAQRLRLEVDGWFEMVRQKGEEQNAVTEDELQGGSS